MGASDYIQAFPGLYDLGSGQNQLIPNGSGFSSILCNLRDLLSPQQVDFSALGPGSQVWMLGYAVRFRSDTFGVPFAVPDELGILLDVTGGFDFVPVFITSTIEQIRLPVYNGSLVQQYSGMLRCEFPVATFSVSQNTGATIECSWQFWAKGQ